MTASLGIGQEARLAGAAANRQKAIQRAKRGGLKPNGTVLYVKV
ncbi:MAG: hypothetical protein AAGD96_24585 [Chloroflexota bacterium]